MRHLLTLFVLLISTLTANAQVYGTPIITWDFANGIPANWTNESNSGIGLWEYRGPNTTPNNTVCSLGSCGATSVPITSVSADNGFVIFDSNFWDDPNGPCGNIGSGPDPGPHGARLITNSIDLTGYSAVSLAFQQQYKHYLCETSVHISVDGGQTWSLIHMNPGNNAFSASSVWVNVNLNATAANQSDVQATTIFGCLMTLQYLSQATTTSCSPMPGLLNTTAICLLLVSATWNILIILQVCPQA
jgi:hypothetical protein